MIIQTTKTVILKANAKKARKLTMALEELIQEHPDCTLASSYDHTMKEASFAFTGSEASLEVLLSQIQQILSHKPCCRFSVSRNQLLKASAVSALALSLICLVVSDE